MESISFEKNFIRQEIPKLDRIFALQEAQKEKIKKIYPVSEKQMTVIGTGYNSEVFKKTGIKSSRKDGKIRMIFAGKITQKKVVFFLFYNPEDSMLTEERCKKSSESIESSGL